MKRVTLADLKKASKIAAKALNLAKKLVRPEVSLLEVAEKIEGLIIEEGGKPAFPVNISINDIAAHYTPSIDDKSAFKEGDVVKIDIGVHINGWIIDTAITIDLGDHKGLIKASKEALENALKVIKKGVELWAIGDVIERTIKKYNLNPIYNLSGHQIEQYNLHAGLTIPNFNNKSKIKLEEGLYAIEPFATNGIGYVKDGNPSGILKIMDLKAPRDRIARKIYDYIIKEYKTLPFAKRWLYKIFPKNQVDYAINLMKKLDILYEYPILVEKSGGLVSQHEKTVLISDRVYVFPEED